MSNTLKMPTERRERTKQTIAKLLRERQKVLVLFCQVAGLEPYTPDKHKPVLAQLQEFCQLLVDYSAFGHFEIYDRIGRGEERREHVANVAEALYPRYRELYGDWGLPRSLIEDSGVWMTLTSASRRASGRADRLSSASCRPSHWVAAVWLVSSRDSTLPRRATGSVTASACTESPDAGTVRRGTPGRAGTWRFTPRVEKWLGCRLAAFLWLVGRRPQRFSRRHVGRAAGIRFGSACYLSTAAGWCHADGRCRPGVRIAESGREVRAGLGDGNLCAVRRVG